jgi:hypothetical protein
MGGADCGRRMALLGTLTVTAPGILTRAGVNPWRADMRHLIVRCGASAEGGVFAGFDVMVDADFTDSTLVDLPVEPEGDRGFFEGCTMLETIHLPQKMSAFADRLFKSCRTLKQVVISPDVTTIGAEAFAGSGLIEIDFEHVACLGQACCEGCTALRAVVPPRRSLIGSSSSASR